MTTKARKPRTPKVETVKRVRSAVLSTGGAKFSDVIPIRGASQQIPMEVIDKAVHETIVPPLGPNSFEDLTRLLVDSPDYATTVEQEATDVAGLGWHLDPIDQDEPMDQAEVDKAMALLAPPQRSMLMGEMLMLGEIIKRAIMDYLTLGNGWIEVIRQNNDPTRPPSGFAHAPGVAMRIRANLFGHVMLSLETNKYAYFRTLFSDPADPRSKDPNTDQPLNEMMYFKRYSPGSPWYGVPRIVPAMRAIKGSVLAAERNIRFFLNRAMPEWTVVMSGETDNISDENYKQLETDIEEYFRNVLKGDDYRTMLLTMPVGINVKFEKVSIDVNDSSHPQYIKANRDEILRAMGMQPNRIGIIESGNIGSGSGESQIEVYKSSTIKPMQEMVERQFNAILHADEPAGLGLKTVNFKFDEIDSIDEAREATIASTLAQTGWLTVNEGRAYASQFLKIHLAPIEEPWADLPLQMVVPRLGEFFGGMTSLQEEPGTFRPGTSTLGTPVAPGFASMSRLERDVVVPSVVLDKAYRIMRERQAEHATNGT